MLGAVLTGGASGASAFADPVGDDNAAPDITSVALNETEEVLEVVVAVANAPVLPAGGRFNLWFDLDGDEGTGDPTGDDALVRVSSEGVELRRWDGVGFAGEPAPGLTAVYEPGVLTVVAPLALLGPMRSPGILVVGARSMVIGGETLTTADFAPEDGRMRWTRGARSSFGDFEGDHDAAPDITAVRVSDERSGWVRFAISVASRARLPDKALVSVSIDRDASPSTGDRGSEVLITTAGGDVELERWDGRRRRWLAAPPSTRVQVRSTPGLVLVSVHRSQLGGAGRFGFRVFSADRSPFTGALVAVDFAPDSGAFWRYRLANAALAQLVTGPVVGSPPRPRAGRAFVVSTPVRLSGASRAISAGTVRCDVRADTTRIRATGHVRRGRARCQVVVPASARTISGSMTIRSGGRTVTTRFRFGVG